MRELKEEFGIVEPEFRFQELGKFEYIRTKDLFLFKLEYGNLHQEIAMSILKCTSYFDKKGKQVPEIDGYKIIAIDEIEKYCYKGMIGVLNKVFMEKIK
jgi:hypothetical protein